MVDMIIRNACLLDVEAGEYRDGASLRVEGDRIVEIALDGADLRGGPDVRVLDVAGRTVMPGLIDAHVHAAITTMDMAAMGRRQASWIAIETKFILEAMLRRGFTTVRDAGGLDAGISSALERGLVNGPRVFRSGRVISQTGGHGDSTLAGDHPQLCACSIRSTSFAHIADGPDAVRRAVREELKTGAHQIKIMAGGGVATPSDPIDSTQYTHEEMAAAVHEARARRTYVLAHAYIPEAIIQAVRVGVRSIEHGNLIDDASARAIAEAGAYLVPTLVTYDQIAEVGRAMKFPEVSLRKLGDVLHAGEAALDVARRNGVKMGFGTDLLGETHKAQSKEFLLRARVLSNIEIIRSATLVNAEMMNQGGELGVLKVGALADLLVVDGDPLADISVLAGQGERLALIMRGGQVIKDEVIA